jgi:hypothetical protein
MAGLMDIVGMGANAVVPGAGTVLGMLGGLFNTEQTSRHRENQLELDKIRKEYETIAQQRNSVGGTTRAKMSNISDAESSGMANAASQGANLVMSSGLGGNINSGMLSALKANSAILPVAAQFAGQKNQILSEQDTQNNQLNQQMTQDLSTGNQIADTYEISKDRPVDLGQGLLGGMMGNMLMGVGNTNVQGNKDSQKQNNMIPPQITSTQLNMQPRQFGGPINPKMRPLSTSLALKPMGEW